MKKIPTLFITFLCILFLSVSVYAKPLETYTVGGTIDFEKDTESTFSGNRIITGSAPAGTIVSISVYNAENGKTFVYETQTGASGLFSKAVTLSNRENTVTLTLSLDGYDSITKETVINKKDDKIKHTLEKGMLIPGEGITNDIVLFYS